MEPENLIPSTTRNEDGCEILGRLQIHEIEQGQAAKLNWQLKNKAGLPINITSLTIAPGTDPETPFDAVGGVRSGVTLRVREATGFNNDCNSTYTVPVEVLGADTGLVRSGKLPKAITNRPGVYIQEWGIIDEDGDMITSNRAYLWVNKGLFGATNANGYAFGPPSVEEIRLSLRDSSAEDNSWLGRVEFDTAEIAQAVLRPIGLWNEVPPPLNAQVDTTNFPFRENWLDAIQGHLLVMAAHHYRRLRLINTGGGIVVDDKNKEREYLQMGMKLLDDYKSFVTLKKIQINVSSFSGASLSDYSRLY